MPDQKSTFDVILDEWQQDARWDITEPGVAIANIPNLHAKYLRYLTKHRTKARALERELAEKRRQVYDYYAGRMTDEQLAAFGRPAFRFVLKTDIGHYVAGDTDIQILETKKALHDEVVMLCDSILRELNSRTYQLSSVIKWQMFQHGQ